MVTEAAKTQSGRHRLRQALSTAQAQVGTHHSMAQARQAHISAWQRQGSTSHHGTAASLNLLLWLSGPLLGAKCNSAFCGSTLSSRTWECCQQHMQDLIETFLFHQKNYKTRNKKYFESYVQHLVKLEITKLRHYFYISCETLRKYLRIYSYTNYENVWYFYKLWNSLGLLKTKLSSRNSPTQKVKNIYLHLCSFWS